VTASGDPVGEEKSSSLPRPFEISLQRYGGANSDADQNEGSIESLIQDHLLEIGPMAPSHARPASRHPRRRNTNEPPASLKPCELFHTDRSPLAGNLFMDVIWPQALEGRFPMALTGMQWTLIWSSSGSVTQEVNIAAQGAIAQISLGQADGGGLLDSGIRGYRTRPNPAGSENIVNFGDNFYDWPNTVFDEHLSSVTFALALGQNQEATGVCNLLFWSP
jgi:hypothetical protein